MPPDPCAVLFASTLLETLFYIFCLYAPECRCILTGQLSLLTGTVRAHALSLLLVVHAHALLLLQYIHMLCHCYSYVHDETWYLYCVQWLYKVIV